MNIVDTILYKLERLIREGRHEALETDGLEIKPTPSSSGSWKEIEKSVNAFLNTRGGIILLGFKEIANEPDSKNNRWEFTGWRPEAEEKLKKLQSRFSEYNGTQLNLPEVIQAVQIRPFMDGQVAVLYVDELSADRKFVFLDRIAWKRQLTGDHKITGAEIERQQEYRDELSQARELQLVEGASLDDLDLDLLNEYIQQLNRPNKIETIKPDLESARSFLERRCFVKDGKITTLGMLVCGKRPEDVLGFRCHVHGYVDVPQKVAQDKQDIIGTVLPLMEKSLGYVLRNIQVGTSIESGGTAKPQYPEEILRETVNNALAHRDYSVNKQAIITIKPDQYISIRNPGKFRKHLLIEFADDTIPVRRIIPEAKARNPRLADVLRVYRKWEGKGIGMATLVNLSLQNEIDLPTFRLYSEEVCLYLQKGPLVGDRMKLFFGGFDKFIEDSLGTSLTEEQRSVLTYILKSAWENERHHYTILLTPDNNHFEQLLSLEKAGLISKHVKSTPLYPIYIPHPFFLQKDYHRELEEIFGENYRALDQQARQALCLAYRHHHYSQTKGITAKMAAFSLWYLEKGTIENIREFDTFYRKIRYLFNKLENAEFIRKQNRVYHLNFDYSKDRLF